ncbi:MAG: glycosyltransferase family 2 protein [Deltaproteobacteria bacterium]|jgi:glycosyltransferase involved in cell wall biosynthesis|nr:glycosyltransferase family 2 protein [Deltaproteobacteria bacterium]
MKLIVLCPTYNHESSIEDCLTGFVRQKTEYDFEVRVIDDCSTDNTPEIIRQYAQKYPHLIKPTLRSVNLGVKRSVWAAYPLQSETTYFTFCEGDDRWIDDYFVQKAISFLDNHPECVMFAGNTLFHDHGKKQQYLPINQKPSCWIDPDRPFYVHTSARIHQYFDRVPVGDMYLLFFYLALGPCYFHSEVVSVYNMTGSGSWSSLDRITQWRQTMAGFYALNKLYNFRYDDSYSHCLFTKRRHLLWWPIKRVLGPKRFWKWYSNWKNFSDDAVIEWSDDFVHDN